MDLINDWSKIRRHFRRSFSSNFYVSVASVDPEGEPTVTPIGSLFLNGNQTGFYFEKFPKKLPAHARRNPKVCLMAVNSGRLFWIKALFRERFADYPAIKLYGLLGDCRIAAAEEKSRLARRMKLTKGLRGHAYLWENMQTVRDIQFTRAEKINLGKMTAHL